MTSSIPLNHKLASSLSGFLLLVALLFALGASASPLPAAADQTQLASKEDIDLGFRRASQPQQKPITGLPLKLYVHAGPKCRSERTHLYYLPENACIGPLYHPAGSFRMLSDLPDSCVVQGFMDGHCRGDPVKIGGQRPFMGPRSRDQCVDINVPSGLAEEGTWEGVNALRVVCGRN